MEHVWWGKRLRRFIIKWLYWLFRKSLFGHQTCSIYYLFNLCLGIVSYNKYWGLFSHCTAWSFSNSNKNFHSCMISICQSNSSQTKKNNLENYIAPLPWLIIMDLPNCFGVFFVGILLNYAYNMVYWRTFYLQASVHPHEISSHTSIISAKNTNVFIVNLLRF